MIMRLLARRQRQEESASKQPTAVAIGKKKPTPKTAEEPGPPSQVIETPIEIYSLVDEPVVPEATVKEKASFFYCLKQTVRSTVQFLNNGQPFYNALILGWKDAAMIRLRAIASLHTDNSPKLDGSHS